MKTTRAFLLFFFLLAGVSSCRTQQVNVKEPEKNGDVIMYFERTACFGTCPVYNATLYTNGLLLFNGVRFTYKTGCFYAVISADDIKKMRTWFTEAGFMSLSDVYPTDDMVPTDLPECNIEYNDGKQKKRVSDKSFGAPIVLTDLQQKLGTWISIQNLQSCGK